MDDEQNQWQYTGGDSDFSRQSAQFKELSWSASEYVAHEKSASWYFMLLGGSLLITIIVYVLNRDIITSVAILTVSLSASFFASRKPASKTYALSEKGLRVDEKLYRYEEFKSFSLVEEGAIDSVWLKPLGRFAPLLVIYFEPKDEDEIIAILSMFLPHEKRELDPIDRMMKRLRF